MTNEYIDALPSLLGRAVTEKQIHEHVQALNVQVESLMYHFPSLLRRFSNSIV